MNGLLFKIVVPTLLYSTLASLAIAAIVGGITRAIVDYRRRRKNRTIQQSPPPRLIFLAMLGSFMGTMVVGFLPILANPSIISSGLYLAIGLLILFLTFIPLGAIGGALFGCWMGDTNRSKVTGQNIAIALSIIYLLMGMAIYRANMSQNNNTISTTSVRAMENSHIFSLSYADDLVSIPTRASPAEKSPRITPSFSGNSWKFFIR